MLDQDAQKKITLPSGSFSIGRVVDMVLIFVLVSTAMMLAKHAFVSEWNEVGKNFNVTLNYFQIEI